MAERSGPTFDEVVVGAALPPFDLPLTLQRLVMEAGVNRDFTPTHHDPDNAVQTGAPGVYANTLLVMSLLEAAVRQWMGPRGVLIDLEARMIRFNVVGTTLRVGGQVVSLDAEASDEGSRADTDGFGQAVLEIWVDNESGRTIEGRATVGLPRGEATAA